MISDGELKASVLAELKWEPRLNAAHIGVTAKDGVVAPSGHVENYADKYAAEAAATRVKGVKPIAQEPDVRLPYAFERSHDSIAAAAIDRHFQHDAASRDIRQLFGVVGQFNSITIKPQINVDGLTSDITKALGRTWFYNSDAVLVTAAGDGKVKLTGSVDTWHERDVAAWAASGVTTVENDIAVL
jgi:osmotically-inducible protein OsmY